MNAPDRVDMLMLPEGVAKVSVMQETNFGNGATFVFEREGHTLANLTEDPHVVFAGYKVPHPLQYKFELKVQTDNYNGSYTPEFAVKNALIAVQRQCNGFMEKLNMEVIKARMDASKTDMVGMHTTTGYGMADME